MTDHLEEARLMADHAGGGDVWRRLDNQAAAIKHLADAIAELRGEDQEDAELMRSVRNMYAKIPPLAIPPETVPELLPEHREREWVDKDGESWRWRDEVWQVYSPEIGWCVAAEGHRASNYRRFGPFTAVPS